MGRRPTPAQLEEQRQAHLQDQPYDTAVARTQPQDPDSELPLDPEQLNWDEDEIWDM